MRGPSRSDWAVNKQIDKRIKELGGGGGMVQHSNEYHDPDMALATHNHDSAYVNEADHTKTAHDALAIGHTSLTDKGTNTHAQVDTHLGASAPHTGHETPAGAQGKVDTHAAVAAPHSGHETPTGAQAKVDTHAAIAAPHSGHEQTANKGVANGYAGLGANSHVPSAQLGSGTANSSTFLRGDGAWAAPGGGSDPWTIVKLGANYSTNGTTNANVTGLAFTPAANKSYLIYGTLLLRTANTTIGARPGIAWPTNADGVARMEATNSATASVIRLWGAKTTQNAASAGLPTTANAEFGGFEAYVIMPANGSGNFQITLASETSGQNVTIQAGSFFMYREIA